jgi:hypothetical protein
VPLRHVEVDVIVALLPGCSVGARSNSKATEALKPSKISTYFTSG